MKLLCVFTGLYCPFCPVEFPVCKGRCLNFSDFIWRCWTSLYQCPILPNQSFIISVDGYPLVKLYTQKNTCWDFGCDCVEFRVSLEDEWHLCPVKSSFHSRPESDGPSHSLILSSLSELSQKEINPNTLHLFYETEAETSHSWYRYFYYWQNFELIPDNF